MTVWIVSREYAGIAEAGGVKNVTCALSENLVSLGHEVVLFIPLYGCSDLSSVEDLKKIDYSKNISAGFFSEKVNFYCGKINGVKIIFVLSKSFKNKHGIYTYSLLDEKKNSEHKRNTAFEDATYLDVLFQKAVVDFANTNYVKLPDIIHCQDATTALIPCLFKYSCEKNIFFENTKFVVTIHNAGPGYHHSFKTIEAARFYTGIPYTELKNALNGNEVEPFLLLTENTVLTTVSPQYANEIMSSTCDTGGLAKRFIEKKITLTGITNGIQFDRYNPENKNISLLPFEFSPEKNNLEGKYLCRKNLIENFCNEKKHLFVKELDFFGSLNEKKCSFADSVFVSYHGRIVHQKGTDLLAQAADSLLSENENVKFIFMGQGHAELENSLIYLTEKYPGQIVFFRGYSRSLARLAVASADFLVLPSFFEPCGLEDFIGQLYGTIPLAHATGGLKKIIDEETGFLYYNNTADEIKYFLKNLLKIKLSEKDIFNTMISYTARYVHNEFSWKSVVQNKYIPLYESLLNKKLF